MLKFFNCKKKKPFNLADIQNEGCVSNIVTIDAQKIIIIPNDTEQAGSSQKIQASLRALLNVKKRQLIETLPAENTSEQSTIQKGNHAQLFSFNLENGNISVEGNIGTALKGLKENNFKIPDNLLNSNEPIVEKRI